MRRLAIFFLLLAGSATAQTISGGVCTISDTLWKNDGTPLVGGRVIVSRVSKNGEIITLGPKTYLSNASGIVSFNVPQGATAYIYADVNGFNTPGGVAIEIPDLSGSTCTYQLGALQPLATVGTAGLTVQNNDVSVGNKHSTIDFSSRFTVTESPTSEANVELATGGITNTYISSSAAIARSKIATGTAHTILKNDASGNMAEVAALTNGQLIIGSTGAAPAEASLTGTSNQITVTPGAGSITLSTPQDLDTAALVQFARAILDTMRITGNGGIRANDDTLYFRKGDGAVAFKIYLGASPSNAQILKADGNNVLTFAADATGGPAAANEEYLVKTLSADLSNERQLVDGAGLGSTDAGGNNTWTWFVNGTDGVIVSSDSLRILLRSLSGLAIKSGIGAVDSVGADTTTSIIQTKTENDALYVPLTRTITGGAGLSNAGDLSADRTLNIQATDGVITSTDSVRLQLASASGLEIVSGVSAIDSLRIDIDGTTLSRSSTGIKIPTDGVTTTEIADGTITNQDVNSSAGIARTKLASGTAHRILVNDASGVMSESSALTNGQLLIGSTGAAQTAANLTAGNNISITNGAGSITVASFPPIQFAVDSAAGIASDTMWVWQNVSGSSFTVDSIHVAASTDDYAISIVKCNYTGGGGALVDAVTASTNGTNLFFITETTITSATISNGQRIGFVKPASTGDRVYVRIHYH